MGEEQTNEPDSGSAEQRVDAGIASYLQALKDGNAPRPQEGLAPHPDLAAALPAVFSGQPRSSAHRADLRGRRVGRTAVLQHEADRGRQFASTDPWPGASSP